MTSLLPSSPPNNLPTSDEFPSTTPYPTIPMVPESSPRDFPRSEPRPLLPTTRQDAEEKVTCVDYLGEPNEHGSEQRYVSPTTGACRKLVVQSVNPRLGEHRIQDHTGGTTKLALWLYCINPFRDPRIFFEWVGKWLLFSLVLLFFAIRQLAQFFYPGLADDSEDDSAAYNTGYYKPYTRPFSGQLWAARSSKEYSSRTRYENEENIPTHSLHPRLLMVRTGDQWGPCVNPTTIIRTKFVAISYRAGDVYAYGPDQDGKKEFIKEVRSAVAQLNLNAYWLDLECIGEKADEKKLDVYCMADVYRGAEMTLIMLNPQESDNRDDAWKRWGERVWTFPEALLSQHLYYKFRDETEIKSVDLHQLTNLAYTGHNLEQAIINNYSGKDPLERLERLVLLKSAIWRRGITLPSQATPSTFVSPSSPVVDPSTRNTNGTSGPYPADRVYALMGFFDHRIQPDRREDDLCALARLSMANDSDRICERMVSLLPTTTSPTARWYADDDVYSANLWDVVPEIQVAGITEQGALVLDGCKAACIRWKDFPEVAMTQSDSIRRKLAAFIASLAWLIIIAGIASFTTTNTGGITLLACGFALLLLSPRMFVYSQAGRVIDPQPWLIGVKGVLDIKEATKHLYGGAVKGRYRCLDFTPSGSEFAVPERGSIREGSEVQYNNAMEAEGGLNAGRTYTLIDTYSSTIYYFTADKPPTVCLFTGREGGLGRFVLCSERCAVNELHKETVLRMPTYISQRMELCGWVALG